jgi:ABC-type Fe3+ transport system permease subunit
VLRLTARLAGMGYAIPGSVIAVGILLPVAWLQALWPAAGLGVLLTASSLGDLCVSGTLHGGCGAVGGVRLYAHSGQSR